MSGLKELTIITIAQKEDSELFRTHKSLLPLLSRGTKWILVISNEFNEKYEGLTCSVVGKDTSLYDALNLGIEATKTEFLMFLHSGDVISSVENLINSYELLIRSKKDCVLGGTKIGKRSHLSSRWRPWMIYFYVQPPHLPIIYKYDSIKKFRFNTSIKTVADFYFLKRYFLSERKTFEHSLLTYIDMAEGGLTTNGVYSALHVTKAFYATDGILAILLMPIRIIIKIIIK